LKNEIKAIPLSLQMVWLPVIIFTLIFVTFQLSCIVALEPAEIEPEPELIEPESAVQWSKTFGSGHPHCHGYLVRQADDGNYIAYARESGGIRLINIDTNGNVLGDNTLPEDGLNSKSLQMTADGGHIWCGTIDSDDKLHTGIGLVRVDKEGDAILEKGFMAQGDAECGLVKQTADGGYIVCGYIGSEGNSTGSIWLIKADKGGNVIWNKEFAGGQCHGVLQTKDGGYLISGTKPPDWRDIYNIWLIKTDADGNMVWEKTFEGRIVIYSFSVQQTSDGDFVVLSTKEAESGRGSNIWLMKIDNSGNLLWEKTWGDVLNCSATAMQQTNDEGYIVCGRFDDVTWLIKTDSEGNTIWHEIFRGYETTYAREVHQTADGGYIVCGTTFDWDEETGKAIEMRIWLIKISADGKTQWEEKIAGDGFARGWSVQETIDGGYIACGKTGEQASVLPRMLLFKVVH
jgi:hypothetical protein